MTDLLKQIAASTWFNRLVLALILISSALVGMETYPTFAPDTEIGKIILHIQDAILWFFVLEIALKIGACGSKPWVYFLNPWNLFDLAIVAVCFLPFGSQFAVVFRMARLLRALRLLTILPDMQVLVTALLRAIPSLGYVGVLLLLHFYIYAVMGTFLFGHNDPVRFGKLHSSMLTLFQVLTLEGWNDVLNTQFLGSDLTYDQEWIAIAGPQRISHPQPGKAAAFFVTFILVGTMVMLNLFTGVIISSMEASREHPEEKKADDEAREKELEAKGFLTLREELELTAHHLREISADVAALKQETSRLRGEYRGADTGSDRYRTGV
jgi:voltage-gated sodium channel